jgi:hypothetical protein
LQPYVIKQGDHLALLAYKFGFDADTVWNDPKNAQLRQLRPNRNLLWPTDILYIPDQNVPPVMKNLTTGTTNSFVSTAPMTTLSIAFVGSTPTSYASRAYTIQELDQLTGLATDGNGVAKFQVPVTLQIATLVFSDTGESYAFSIGEMDPINTLSGIFKRLQNLGYVDTSAQLDAFTPANNLGILRAGLLTLKASQAPSGADSAPASSPTPDSAPPSSGEADMSTLGSASAGNSAPAPDSAPSSPSSDDSGLADDGTLDTTTTALLLNAHGS